MADSLLRSGQAKGLHRRRQSSGRREVGEEEVRGKQLVLGLPSLPHNHHGQVCLPSCRRPGRVVRRRQLRGRLRERGVVDLKYRINTVSEAQDTVLYKTETFMHAIFN